jgi:hypothetical protein
MNTNPSIQELLDRALALIIEARNLEQSKTDQAVDAYVANREVCSLGLPL